MKAKLNRGYYMAGIRILSSSDESISQDKIRIPKWPCNVLFIYRYGWNPYIKHNFFLFIFETAK